MNRIKNWRKISVFYVLFIAACTRAVSASGNFTSTDIESGVATKRGPIIGAGTTFSQKITGAAVATACFGGLFALYKTSLWLFGLNKAVEKEWSPADDTLSDMPAQIYKGLGLLFKPDKFVLTPEMKKDALASVARQKQAKKINKALDFFFAGGAIVLAYKLYYFYKK